MNKPARHTTILSLILTAMFGGAVLADDAQVVAVKAQQSGIGWRFDVTVQHDDTGWDHYANAWEVLDKDGNRLGLRKLAHPHVEEQPFTRSLNSVMVPDGTRVVYVRASCSQSGWSEQTVAVTLTH